MSIHISSKAWKVKGLSASQKLVLLKLSDMSNDEGICWPSIPTIARECDCSERTVQRIIIELSKVGHLTRENREGKVSIFCIHPTIFDLKRGDIGVTGDNLSGVTSEVLGGDKPGTTLYKETSKKHNVGKITKNFAKPTPQQVADYGREIGFEIDGESFFDYYESKGWLIGKTKMKCWKSAIRTWKRNSNQKTKGGLNGFGV
jgi:hypothetical protein